MNKDRSKVDEEKENKIKPKRIITLDALRGFAIFFMVFFHTIYKIYDYDWLVQDYTVVLNFPFPVLVLFGLIAYLGTWHGFFLFISSIVNAYVLIKKFKRTNKPESIVGGQILTGILLWWFGWFEQGIGYWGALGNYIRTGEFSFMPYVLRALFTAETLQIIGLSLILNAVILYFLVRTEKGQQKLVRNILVYVFLCLIVILTTYYVREHWDLLFNDIFGGNLPPITTDVVYHAYQKSTIATWFVSMAFGGIQPLFPFLATAFTGSIIGLLLSKPEKTKKMPLLGMVSGFLCMGSGILMIIFGYEWSTVEVYTALSIYLLRLGGQIVLVWFMLLIIEFRGTQNHFARKKITRFFRLWGLISLTLYVLQIIEYLPLWLYHLLFSKFSGINFMEQNSFGRYQGLGALITTVFAMLFFHLMILLWAKINFIGSFEWLLLKIKEKVTRTARKKIDVNLLIDEVEPIGFNK